MLLEQKELHLKQAIKEKTLEQLKKQIKNLKETYLITSPINGKLTFAKIWIENSYVQKGESIGIITPNKHSGIIGKMYIPSKEIGKVKEGLVVNIKPDNFPSMEYGTHKGE